MNDRQEVGRLALRVEGRNWTAYWAQTDTLEGAIFLGSISMALVQDPVRKDQFQSLMRDCLADKMEEAFGERPEMITRLAPESERSGNA